MKKFFKYLKYNGLFLLAAACIPAAVIAIPFIFMADISVGAAISISLATVFGSGCAAVVLGFIQHGLNKADEIKMEDKLGIVPKLTFEDKEQIIALIKMEQDKQARRERKMAKKQATSEQQNNYPSENDLEL